jgi:1-acyl-sn-glycerol-3-phosphate acyltransferase
MWLNRLTVALGPVIGLYWRLGLTGAVETIPRHGPIILTMNHACFLDPWLLSMVFPRPIRYLINHDWYHRSRLWTAFFRANGTVPIIPEDSHATIDMMRRILDRGEVVGFFPEGRISHDGKIQRFHRGLTRLAALSGAPVVPTGIRGNFESLPRHRRFPKPNRITIRVGEPVHFPGAPYPGPPPRLESKRFHERIIRETCRLAGQEDRLPELLRSSSST